MGCVLLHSISLISADRFTSFKKNGLEGYKDGSGNIIVPAKYNWVQDMGTGFIMVNLDNKYGIYTYDGTLISEPIYEKLPRFSFGVKVFVVCKNGKYGVIDKEGKLRIPISYYAISVIEYSYYQKCIYVCRTKDLIDCVFDENFNVIIPTSKNINVNAVGGEKKDITLSRTAKIFYSYANDTIPKSGVMDFGNNRVLLETAYDKVLPDDATYETYNYIVYKGDAKGKISSATGDVIVEPEAKESKEILSAKTGEKFILLRTKESKRAILSMNGDTIIPAIVDSIKIYQSYFFVRDNTTKGWGVYNFNGLCILDPIYTDLSFNTKFKLQWFKATDVRTKKTCLITPQKELIFPPIYEGIDVLDEDKQYFKYKGDNGRYGLVDKNNKILTEPIYNDLGYIVSTVKKGNETYYYFSVQNNGKQGLIDMNGRLVVPVIYTFVFPMINCPYGYARIVDGDYYGVYNLQKEEITIPTVYTSLEYDKNTERYIGKTNKRVSVIGKGGELISDKNYNKTVDEYIDLADCSFDKRQYISAANYYGKALEIEPTANLYFNRAASYYNVSEYGKAKNDLKMCLQTNPSENTQRRANELLGKINNPPVRTSSTVQCIALPILGLIVGSIGSVCNQMYANSYYNNGFYYDNLSEQSVYNAILSQSIAEANMKTQEMIKLQDLIMQQSIYQAQQQDQAEYEELKSAYSQWGKDLSYEEYVNIKLQAYNANNSDSDNNSRGFESGGFDYREMYTRYEKVVKDAYESLTIGGYSNSQQLKGTSNGNVWNHGNAYSSMKTTFLEGQKNMKRIRSEASQHGVDISPSQWETASISLR